MPHPHRERHFALAGVTGPKVDLGGTVQQHLGSNGYTMIDKGL
jgi:hypothetical protein